MWLYSFLSSALQKDKNYRVKNRADARTRMLKIYTNTARLPNVYSLQYLFLGGDITINHFGNYVIMMIVGDLLTRHER